MQIELKKLTTQWIAFSDIVIPEEGVTYMIQNRGSNILIAYESDVEPEEENNEGVLVIPYEDIKYTAENELYLRAYNDVCSINISTVKNTSGGAIQ